MGGLECYTTWLELWVFLCFREQREGPLLSLHQCKETFSYHRGLGKSCVSPVMIAWGGGRNRVKRLEGSLKSPLCLWDLSNVINLVNAGDTLRDPLSTWLQILVGLLQKMEELTD